MALPILYSYRRCPYAMRARMALHYAGVDVEVREIALRDKPAHMLTISPKGTVPVLQLITGEVLEQSLDIMYWALQHSDTENWLAVNASLAKELIDQNDTGFKHALDRYKYPDRHPDKSQNDYRRQGEVFLCKLEGMLSQHQFLLKATPSFADVAIFPFVRQFAAVDTDWFDSLDYPHVRAWLNGWVNSELFMSIMQKRPIWQDS